MTKLSNWRSFVSSGMSVLTRGLCKMVHILQMFNDIYIKEKCIRIKISQQNAFQHIIPTIMIWLAVFYFPSFKQKLMYLELKSTLCILSLADDNSALIQVVALHQTGAKPLPELMMTKLPCKYVSLPSSIDTGYIPSKMHTVSLWLVLLCLCYHYSGLMWYIYLFSSGSLTCGYQCIIDQVPIKKP